MHWDHEPDVSCQSSKLLITPAGFPLSAPILMGGERVRVR